MMSSRSIWLSIARLFSTCSPLPSGERGEEMLLPATPRLPFQPQSGAIMEDVLRAIGVRRRAGPFTEAILLDVLRDIVVGRRAGPFPEAVLLDVPDGLAGAAAFVLLAINLNHDTGAVQTGPAMQQHWIVGRIVHDFEEAIDGGRPFWRRRPPRDQ